ncbi:MAG: hypothetical protein E5W83_00365 [Mesorhizobium sp.]|nr:MAG: hypothetical protein E5W83_00365 [Mesorhizobium sp.]
MLRAHPESRRAGRQAPRPVGTALSRHSPGDRIVFTFFWPDAGRWENVDFSVGIDEPDRSSIPQETRTRPCR